MSDIQYQLVTFDPKAAGDVIFLYGDEVASRSLPLKRDEAPYVERARSSNKEALVVLDRLPHHLYLQNFDSECSTNVVQERLRRCAADIVMRLRDQKCDEVTVTGQGAIPEEVIAFVEGLTMASYAFDKYKTQKEHRLKRVLIDQRFISAEELQNNIVLWQHIGQCRDWVNEPVMNLNAEQFADQLSAEAKRLGVSCTVLEKNQIEALKMGGLLAVNRGSVDEPRFVVLEYNPADAVNAKAVALVGKGVMYDTGGLNIKPDDYMQEMKSDMAGAATMAAALFAAAENRLPVHMKAYLPLTDNRPSFNAYAADDILRMFDGTTVEVVNTDAEGRLILADAIAYARKEEPELIIDAATLTGAAVRAIGSYGIAAMQQGAENAMSLLKIVGDQVSERLAEFPFWKDYDALISSEVADMKNCGPSEAGAITAGKFLAHFAGEVPFVHLDIAGVAYHAKRETFYGVGASGFGVRLLYAFFQTYDAMLQK